MSTVFITSFHPLIARNILRTELIAHLVPGHAVVLLVPEMKREFFCQEFEREGVRVEGVDTRLSRRDLWFRRLALAILPSQTLFLKKWSEWKQGGRFLTYLGYVLPAYFFGRSRLAIRILRGVDLHFSDTRRVRPLFEQHQPRLVFSTDLQNETDVSVLQEARRRGVRSVGMVRSWDTLTTKGLVRALPDRVVVNNHRIKEQAIRYHQIPAPRIAVVGIPHYDRYARVIAAQGTSLPIARDEFFARHGFVPGKPIVLYTPAGSRYLAGHSMDELVIQTLSELPINLLVRLPPTDTVAIPTTDRATARIAYEETGVRAWKHGERGGGRKVNEMSSEDEETLVASLWYADVVVAGLSTILIDAVFFGKPVVSVALGDEGRKPWEQFRRYHGYDHIRPLLESGGVRFAYTRTELEAAVGEYLRQPTQDQEGRSRLLGEEIVHRDGRATPRLAGELLTALRRVIFITAFEGVEAKNLLRTPVLPSLLSDPEVELVFFMKSSERVWHYRKEFADPRIHYEVTPRPPVVGIERLFRALKFFLLRTGTTDLRRRMIAEDTGQWFRYHGGRFLNWLLARRVVRRLVRVLDFWLVQDRTYAPYVDRYCPTAVLLAHLFEEREVHLLREAKRRGIPTIGFINSWDKVTARSTLRLLPDAMLVFNSLVRQEVMEFDDMPAAAIHTIGIPQYDFYFTSPASNREEFFRRIRADAGKSLIVYAPMGRAFSRADWDMIDLLGRWTAEDRWGQPVELLVRFQPNDFVGQEELRRRPWLRYDYPGVRFSTERGVDWDMDAQDLLHLRDTLAHMSLLICYASSMSVDAAVFDKPVININFDLSPAARLSQSPTLFYQMTHYQKALQNGGIRLANSAEELLHWAQRYLNDPSLDRAGRKRLRDLQCGYTDGKSGERLARLVLAVSQRAP